MKYCFFIVVLLFSFGCHDASKSSGKDQVISDQQQKIKELQDKLEKKEIEDNPRDTRNPNYDVFKDPDLVQIDLGKFVFAVIETEKQVSEKSEFSNGMPTVVQKTIRVSKVSDIHRIEFYSGEKRQKFKDLVRKNASMAEYWRPKVYSIEVKEFASYSEASQAREKLSFNDEVTVILPTNF
ncbi:MAG: hypothetical protein U0U70_00615 [Chitinophagaceae bacterium]